MTRLSEHQICKRLSAVVTGAVEHTALWRSLLGQRGPTTYHSLEEFRERVPYVDKRLLFDKARRQVTDGLRGGDLSQVRRVIPSSGTGGDSLGMSFLGQGDIVGLAGHLDRHLDAAFAVSSLPTLLISALPGGVEIPSAQHLSVYAGVRPDLALRMLERLSDQYPQTVIVAEPFFGKRLLEYLHARGYPLRRRRIHLVLGGYYLPENLRDYLAWLLGIRLDAEGENQRIFSTFGMGEVGLNLMSETPQTVALRRYLRDRPLLVARLCGADLPTAPMIFTHDPSRVYIEVEDQRLVFTMLDPDRLQPVIRYDSGDWGGTIPNWRLREGLPGDLMPLVPADGSDLHWLYGRHGVVVSDNTYVTVPRVLEAMFAPARALHEREDRREPGREGAAWAHGDLDTWTSEHSVSRLMASITGHFTFGPSRRETLGRGPWELLIGRRLPSTRPEAHHSNQEARQVEPLDAEAPMTALSASIERGLDLPRETLDLLNQRPTRPSVQESWAQAAALDIVATAVPPEELRPGDGSLFEEKPRFLDPEPVYRQALTSRDRERVYRLRHFVFVTQERHDYGALGQDAALRMIRDPADHGATHFIAESGTKLVGALRVVTQFELFEDQQDFGFGDWVGGPSSPKGAPSQTAAAHDAPYDVRFDRRRVALVGRVCIPRAERGSGNAIADHLMQLALSWMARQAIEAVFLDCRHQHVQRYLAMGFIEYKRAYVHAGTGQRYHTLIGLIDDLPEQRDQVQSALAREWDKSDLRGFRALFRVRSNASPSSIRALQHWKELFLGAPAVGEPDPWQESEGEAIVAGVRQLGDLLVSALRADIASSSSPELRTSRRAAISFIRYRLTLLEAGLTPAELRRRSGWRAAIRGTVHTSLHEPVAGAVVASLVARLATPKLESGGRASPDPPTQATTGDEPGAFGAADCPALPPEFGERVGITPQDSLTRVVVRSGPHHACGGEQVAFIERGTVWIDADGAEAGTPGSRKGALGSTVGALAALTLEAGVIETTVAWNADARFRLVTVGAFHAALKASPQLSIGILRQLVGAHRRGGAPGVAPLVKLVVRNVTLREEALSPRDAALLCEGLELQWKARHTVLHDRADFADRVWFVRNGTVELFSERADQDVHRVITEPAQSVYSLDRRHSAPRELGGSPTRRERATPRRALDREPLLTLRRHALVGAWSALLGLVDPAVSPRGAERVDGSSSARRRTESPPKAAVSPLGEGTALDARYGLPPSSWIHGVDEGESRTGPQPHRYGVTARVVGGNALVYELDRAELLHRLESSPQLAYAVLRHVATQIVRQAAGPGGAGTRTPRPTGPQLSTSATTASE